MSSKWKFNKDEHSVIICKDCGVMKKRFHAGKYPNNKDIRWVDDTGRQFNGKSCAQCNLNRVNLNNRIKKEMKRAASNAT